MVEIYSGSTAPVGTALSVVDSIGSSVTAVTGGLLIENGSTIAGVYTASFASTSSLETIFDVWHTGSGVSRTEFYTGSYEPLSVGTTDLLYDTVKNQNFVYLLEIKTGVQTFIQLQILLLRQQL
jgi:hypothetical protein